MIKLSILLDCAESEILGAKEAIMNDLEKYGDAKIIEFSEMPVEQMKLR